jgi:hypothetical protein
MKIIRLLSIAIFLGAALGTTSCVMSGLDGVEYHAVVYGINTYNEMRNLNNAANDGAVDSHIKLNKPSHEQLNNFAGKLTDRPPCGKAAG